VGRAAVKPKLFVPLQAGVTSSLLDPEAMMVINAALPKEAQVGTAAIRLLRLFSKSST